MGQLPRMALLLITTLLLPTTLSLIVRQPLQTSRTRHRIFMVTSPSTAAMICIDGSNRFVFRSMIEGCWMWHLIVGSRSQCFFIYYPVLQFGRKCNTLPPQSLPIQIFCANNVRDWIMQQKIRNHKPPMGGGKKIRTCNNQIGGWTAALIIKCLLHCKMEINKNDRNNYYKIMYS